MSNVSRTTQHAAEVQTRQNRQETPAARLIRKVLIANRGEIACRVMRTCRAMGIATAAVYSDADANARHVREADEAVRLGPALAAESYLNIPALLDAARRAGADAVHPGYGFLAENAEFAAACRDAGLTFIGPRPEVIARMGSKREAKLLMAAAGVPVVPGYSGADQSDARFAAEARSIGYPVLVKASAGGGGKGMRAVARDADLMDALAGARREALVAFGDDSLLLERLIAAPRHVEFQIFGDEQGNVIHLGERECSIQRRHQKVIEETPSTALTPELRARMAAAAGTVGRTLGYTNAGTVELILDATGSFYFLEVNTRLQVEHAVTELVTGLDLVRWQIRVAEGHPLPLAQDEVRFTGHAVEARLYAEDPAAGFLPATGPVLRWRAPEGEGVRVDAGIMTGDAVSPYYDPLLAKLVAWGEDRDEALRRLDRALANTLLFGVQSNRDFLRRALLHPDHRAGRISTAFIEQHAADLIDPASGVLDGGTGPETAALVAALARLRASSTGGFAAGWRNNPGRPIIETFSLLDVAQRDAAAATGEHIAVRLTPAGVDHFDAVCAAGGNETRHAVALRAAEGDELALEVDGHRLRAVVVAAEGEVWWVQIGDTIWALRRHGLLAVPAASRAIAPGEGAAAAANGRRSVGALLQGMVAAPMPGQIIAVLVALGQEVRAGEPLVILEAMKMEHTVRAPRTGIVSAIHVAPGEQAQPGGILLELATVATTAVARERTTE